MEKMTNKIALTVAIAELTKLGNHAEVVGKLEKMLLQVEKKSNAGSTTGKQTKTQKENVVIKETILTIVTEPMQAKDVAEVLGVSIQKASALLNQMVKSGELEKTIEKKVTRFSPILPEGEKPEEEMEENDNEELDELMAELDEMTE